MEPPQGEERKRKKEKNERRKKKEKWMGCPILCMSRAD
jgi:hypothetical protein